ncbi:MAG: hypothetical protein M3Y87_21785 [Myxococcota bacterium]|nr:hypothetical protein [Myxococcota bacterium]
MSDDPLEDWGSAATGTPLEVGDVLATTFRTIGANAGPVFGLTAAVVIPSTLVGIALQVVQHYALRDLIAGGTLDPSAAAIGALVIGFGTLVITILSALATIALQGALTHLTIESLLGRGATAGEAVRASLGRLLPLIGTAFLAGLISMIGIFLCIVPGVIAWVWLVVAVPVCFAERLGPLDALQRSVELTEGHRLTIFLVGLVLTVALTAITMCVISPAMVVAFQQALDRGGAATALEDPLAPLQLLTAALSAIVQTFGIAVLSVMPAVVFVRLRGLGGVDAKAVARVFV